MHHHDSLIKAAVQASERAYAPYSNFSVGAALELSDGTIIPGCNVENASNSLTNCAERTALFSAIAQGRKDFVRIAIYVNTDDFISPCGACRQVLFELAPEITVLLVNARLQTKEVTVKELLPFPFSPDNLKAGRKI